MIYAATLDDVLATLGCILFLGIAGMLFIWLITER